MAGIDIARLEALVERSKGWTLHEKHQQPRRENGKIVKPVEYIEVEPWDIILDLGEFAAEFDPDNLHGYEALEAVKDVIAVRDALALLLATIKQVPLPPVAPQPFRCKCGARFTSQEDLNDHVFDEEFK